MIDIKALQVGSRAWIEALATEWERRATVLDALPHSGMVEMVMAQSFRDRAEDLRRTHEKSAIR